MTCTKENQGFPKVIENLPDKNHWVLFNLEMSGLYKVKYDKRNWKLIVNALNGPNYRAIPTVNRAQLIDDAMALAW